MVAALPVKAIENVLATGGLDDSEEVQALQHEWTLRGRTKFDSSPAGYVTELCSAQRPGTLRVVNELLHSA